MADAEYQNSLVQQLFERELGPPRELPVELNASSSSAGFSCRELEMLKFKAAKGRQLEYQTVPAVGALLGITYQPPRQLPPHCPRRRQQPQQQDPATSQPLQPPPPAVPASQPAHCTLWALVQPNSSLGINTAMNAVDGGLTGFAGWTQDGFVDLSSRVGIDYSMTQHPASGLSADVDIQATMPKLPLLPRLTATHSVAGKQASRGLQHTTTLSAPLLRGAASAKVRVVEPPPSASSSVTSPGSTVTVEIAGRSKRNRGLAGGAKLLPAHAEAFRGSSGSSGAEKSSAARSGSDSDSEESSGGGSSSKQQKGQQRVPLLRVEMVPASMRSWADLNCQWRQAWGGRLNSNIDYKGHQQRWHLAVSQKLSSALTAASTFVWDGPPSSQPGAAAAAAMQEAAGAGGLAGLAAAADVGRAHLGAYLRGMQLSKAGLKLTYRLRRPAKQQLVLESVYDGQEGLAHSVKYRLGKGGEDEDEYQQQRARCNLGLQARPSRHHLELTLDFFAPL